MKKNLNQVTVQGTLGADPKFYEHEEYGKTAFFSIANNNSFKKDDQKIEHTVWVACKAKNSTAQFVKDYFSKGDRVIITGQLRNDTREVGDKKVQTMVLQVDEIFKTHYKQNQDDSQKEA